MSYLQNITIPEKFRNKPLSEGNWRKTVGVFIAILGISTLVGKIDLFKPIGLSIQDTLMKINPHKAAEYTEVVAITPEDYKLYFHETSPLDPKQLMRIIDKLLLFKPAVLAIDIDTSSDSFANSGLLNINSDTTRLVWPRGAIFNDKNEITELKPILGNPQKEPDYSGVTYYKRDIDLKNRMFEKCVPHELKPEDMFHWAILNAYFKNFSNPEQCSTLSDKDPLTRPRFRQFYQIDHSLKSIMESPSTPPDENPFKDKVLLLGGHYSEQDTGMTPLGKMHGVDIIRQAVEAELSNDVMSEINPWVIFFLKVIIGILIAVINVRFKPIFALFFSISLMIVCLIAATSSFYLGAIWVDVGVFFIAILIEQLVQGAENAQHMLEQLSAENH